MQTRNQALIHHRGGRWLAAAVLLAFGVGSQATTISFTDGYHGPTDADDYGLYLSQFDPSLGTLNSATFELDATMTSVFYATNVGAPEFGLTLKYYDYYFTMDGVGPVGSLAIADIGAKRGDTVPLIVIDDEQITWHEGWGVYAPTLSDSHTATFSSSLEGFMGTGDLEFLLNAFIYASMAATSVNDLSWISWVDAAVTVTYDYTPVPVPAAAWLLGSALGLLGVMRRRANAC